MLNGKTWADEDITVSNDRIDIVVTCDGLCFDILCSKLNVGDSMFLCCFSVRMM